MCIFLSRKKILPCLLLFTASLLGQLIQTSSVGFREAAGCIYITSKCKSVHWPAPIKGSWDFTFKHHCSCYHDRSPDDSLLARQASGIGGKADLKGS